MVKECPISKGDSSLQIDQHGDPRSREERKDDEGRDPEHDGGGAVEAGPAGVVSVAAAADRKRMRAVGKTGGHVKSRVASAWSQDVYVLLKTREANSVATWAVFSAEKGDELKDGLVVLNVASSYPDDCAW
jgi:hypothetical protein